MKKAVFIATLFGIGTLATAQPHCFIIGPSMNVGSSTITNYSFTRTTVYDSDGAPDNVFSNLGNATNKATSAGIYLDMYKKHSRFAFDIMLPFKESAANWFNLNWAWGGYIKDKVGILAGFGFYSNSKTFSVLPDDPNATLLSLSADPTNNTPTSFYNNSNLSGCGGVDLLLTYALKENVVFRVDYGIYLGDIVPNKVTVPESYRWKGKSTKLEIGAVWQFSDILGIALKYTKWNTTGTYTGDVDYATNFNPNNIVTRDLTLMPEKTISSSNFTFSIMIPLGGAESQSGTITVSPVN